MAITKDVVRYVSDLARIELEEKDIDHFTFQLDRILEYVNKLNEIDVTGLPPTSHVLELKNVYREDRVGKSLPVDEVLKNASLEKNNLFQVKNII